MEPTPPMSHRRPEKPASSIVGTGLVLVLAFLVVLVLFFMFSSLAPLFMGKCLAVVDINQELMTDGTPASLLSAGTPGSEEMAQRIEELDKRDDIGGVLFIINSPGGSVVATREVYTAVKEIKKPKVAFLREVAASGAYYVATGTDYIVSDPDVITGSIGVKTTVMEMSGLLEKIGVNVSDIKSGPHKDMDSGYRNMTDEEQAILQGMIDEVYQEFRSVVLENRGDRLNKAKFNEVTDGRILTGRQALKAGLVDQVGTRKDAIMKAAELANISAASADEVRLCEVSMVSEQGGLFSMEGLIRSLQASSGVRISYR